MKDKAITQHRIYLFLIDCERVKELQRITENLVAENITGLKQPYSNNPGQMGCKVFTLLEVVFSHHKQQVFQLKLPYHLLSPPSDKIHWLQHLIACYFNQLLGKAEEESLSDLIKYNN